MIAFRAKPGGHQGAPVVIGHRAWILEAWQKSLRTSYTDTYSSETAMLDISNLVGWLVSPQKPQERARVCCGFKGSTQTKGNRFVIIPTGCSDIWPHTWALAQLIRENTKQKTPGAKIWGDWTGCFVCVSVRMHILIVAFDQVYCSVCVNFLQISHSILLLYSFFSFFFILKIGTVEFLSVSFSGLQYQLIEQCIWHLSFWDLYPVPT